jgi:serine/threonine protein kinase
MPSDERYYVHKALLRENQILQRLEHPFIVSYLGYEELESGEARLYLEYCEGGDLQTTHVKPVIPARDALSDDEDDLLILSSKLSRIPSGPECMEALKESDVWAMLYQLFAALAYLHYGVSISRQGACRFEHHWDPVVHRDIKPHNGKWHFFLSLSRVGGGVGAFIYSC